MADTKPASTALYALDRTLGVRLAMDDFGTGYSSLSYLSRFPIASLKIDQSFLRDMKPGGHDASIIHAVIGMGSALKLRVIAKMWKMKSNSPGCGARRVRRRTRVFCSPTSRRGSVRRPLATGRTVSFLLTEPRRVQRRRLLASTAEAPDASSLDRRMAIHQHFLIILVLNQSRGSDSFPLQDDGLDRQRNESGAEELHAGPAVHLALDRLQSIDLSLDRPVAPAVGHGRLHRQNVPLQPRLEVLDQAMPLARARSIHRCNAVTVRIGPVSS